MLNYLVGKHRCGVIKSGYHGIKDMYLMPLLRHSPIPTQLLPFDGPGQPSLSHSVIQIDNAASCSPGVWEGLMSSELIAVSQQRISNENSANPEMPLPTKGHN